MKKLIGITLMVSAVVFVNNAMAEIRNIGDTSEYDGPISQGYNRPTTRQIPNRAYYNYQNNSQIVEDEYEDNTPIDLLPANLEPEEIKPIPEAINTPNITPTETTTETLINDEPVKSINSNAPEKNISTIEKLENMFNAIDSNTDGYVTKGEFIDFHDKVMRKKTEKEMQKEKNNTKPKTIKPLGRIDIP